MLKPENPKVTVTYFAVAMSLKATKRDRGVKRMVYDFEVGTDNRMLQAAPRSRIIW